MFPKVYFTGNYFPGQYFEPVTSIAPSGAIVQKLILVGTRNILNKRTIRVNIGMDGLATRKDDN